ncbi:very-long-chain 3-oxoacyl-CoA reductase 1-like [Prosopis cineraria]|uniref:very-long-chain 3-oxoacyl-CoA reductase 1-like n=1 Tax=Prosopis cineraria TaxID=364024 RepID=UPI00240EFE54|nr:very-long-chain 3-oxoacyl-CoA reductase 1-like [Prosopis cineraria]
MELKWPDIFLVATCSLGFITLLKTLTSLVKWVWVMVLRPPKNLKTYGSWAIVTGSTDGIGKALSFELASKGLNILLVGRSHKKLEATMKEIRDKHGDEVEVKLAVIDFENVNGEEIVKKMEEATEGLDDVGILINNAGIGEPYPRFFHENDPEIIDAVVKVNLEGPTWMTKAILPKMMKKKKGAIVNIGSASASVVPSFPLHTTYSATKAYVAMLSKCISLEYKTQGIDIQCQVPLYVATKMTKMKASLLVPSAEKYSKASCGCIGHERECEPNLVHSLQRLLVGALPHAFCDWYLMRAFLALRKETLCKD